MKDHTSPITHRSTQIAQPLVEHQQSSFQRLLQHVWSHSPFYREYYGSCGIREDDLPQLSVRDLPFVSKNMLMEHFDLAVTDSRLKKKELEQWIQEVPDPSKLYRDEFIVLHTSGSS